MKKLQDIIASGKLESYLLGDLSGQEIHDIEALLNSDEEARRFVQELEISLEHLAKENAISPPSVVKEKLFNALLDKKNTPKIIPLATKKSPWLQVAASLAVLLGATSFWLFTERNSLENQIQVVIINNESLQNKIDGLQTNYNEISQWYGLINDPATQKYILKGNTKAPNAIVLSYVNHSQKKVVINAENLPMLSQEHDYQLWADVDGEMIDMGIIPKERKMIAMQYIDSATSLNITIEPAGGNDHASVDQLITNVYLTP
jgi:anti-sigma-K factor RskA